MIVHEMWQSAHIDRENALPSSASGKRLGAAWLHHVEAQHPAPAGRDRRARRRRRAAPRGRRTVTVVRAPVRRPTAGLRRIVPAAGDGRSVVASAGAVDRRPGGGPRRRHCTRHHAAAAGRCGTACACRAAATACGPPACWAASRLPPSPSSWSRPTCRGLPCLRSRPRRRRPLARASSAAGRVRCGSAHGTLRTVPCDVPEASPTFAMLRTVNSHRCGKWCTTDVSPP